MKRLKELIGNIVIKMSEEKKSWSGTKTKREKERE